MQRAVLAVVFATVLAAGYPAAAQLGSQPSPSSQVDRSLVGLPVISADGEKIGQVTEVGVDDGQAVLVAEIERPLGFGSDPVAIPAEMFANKGDHIELTIPAVVVRDRLARPEQ
jgi:hypothetical protein